MRICFLIVIGLLCVCGKSKVDDCLLAAHQHQMSFIGCVLCNPGAKRKLPVVRSFVAENSTRPTSHLVVDNVFSTIYATKTWSEAGGGSGVGSDASYAVVVGHIIRLVMYKFGLSSLVDAPCGAVSLSWTKNAITSIHQDLPCFRYHGVDVVSSVIEQNKKHLEELSSWVAFSVIDISARLSTLPSNYDLILSRDALQHLSYQNIAGALSTYCRSESSYILVGSYLDSTVTDNKNIQSGGCFSINLLLPPFNFSNPLEVFAERGKLGVLPFITTITPPQMINKSQELKVWMRTQPSTSCFTL